jgi:DNA-binding NarL/FixJ family response regulator
MTIASLRSCSRCGREFEGTLRAHICDVCRKPRPLKNVFQGQALTARERQVVVLVSQALANKEIAWQLHLAEGTVKVYLSTIYKKLEIPNRTKLALWAMANQRNAA